MAFYQNAPGRNKAKKNYAENGAWEEEGSRYHKEEKNSEGGRQRSSGSHIKPSRPGKSPGRGKTDRNASTFFRGKESDRRLSKEYREKGTAERKNFSEVREQKNPITRSPEEKQDYRDFQYRPAFREENASGEELILCGRNPIREALKAGRDIEKIFVQKGELSGSAREIIQSARERKIMIQETDKRRMDELATHHQGLIAIASAYAYSSVEEMLDSAIQKREDPFLIILDGVTDPHNLGAIIRTAECVGAHGVILPQHRSVGLVPAAVKASAGAIEHMKVARVTNLNRLLDELKNRGIWTYAVTMDGKDYEKVDFRGGTALVIGAEGEGISRLTAEKCDMAVSLPMKGALDSLNASVAAGIMMYRVFSCRR